MKKCFTVLLAILGCLSLSSPSDGGTASPGRKTVTPFHPDAVTVERPLKVSAQGGSSTPRLGKSRMFWTWNLNVMPPRDVQIKATCRGIGENIYVLVADTEWLTRVNQKDVNRIIEAFDHSTPPTSMAPSRGIYDIVTGTFAPPPDVDNDPKIYLLISQLSEYRGHTFDGYFRYLDQLDVQHGNHADILHLDSDNPSNDYHLGVLAHEFHHLIQWAYDKKEASWISESMAEVSMVICGYYTDEPKVSKYLGYTNQPLVELSHADYGACLLWGVYLYDRFGGNFLSALMKEEADSIEGFECAMKTAQIDKDFKEIFGDWMTANYLNDPTVDGGKYAYKSITIPRPSVHQQFSGMPVRGKGKVHGYGVKYIRLLTHNVDNHAIRVTIKSDYHKDLLVRAIKINNARMSRSTVEQIALPSHTSEFYISNSGGGFDEIVLAITALRKTDKPLPYIFTAAFVPE